MIHCSATRRQAVLLAAWLNHCSSCLLGHCHSCFSNDSFYRLFFEVSNSSISPFAPHLLHRLLIFANLSLQLDFLFLEPQFYHVSGHNITIFPGTKSFLQFSEQFYYSVLKPRSYISWRDFPVQTRSLATYRMYSDSILARALDKFLVERQDSAGSESSASLPRTTSRN